MSNSVHLNGVNYRKSDIKSVSAFYEENIPDGIEYAKERLIQPYKNSPECFIIPEWFYSENIKTRTHKGGILSPDHTEATLTIDKILTAVQTYQAQWICGHFHVIQKMGIDVPFKYFTSIPHICDDKLKLGQPRTPIVENIWRDLHQRFNLTKDSQGKYHATFSDGVEAEVVAGTPSLSPEGMDIKAAPDFEEVDGCLRYIREEIPEIIQLWDMDKVIAASNISLFDVQFYDGTAISVKLNRQVPTLSDIRALYQKCLEAIS